jgi:hypothetical protein
MELGAPSLADRRRDHCEFPVELVERVAQTMAEAHSWKQCPQTLGGAVKAIGEEPPDSIPGLLLGRNTLQLSIGLNKGCCAGLRGVAEMPEHAATDNHRQIDLVGETATVLLVGQEVDQQWQTARVSTVTRLWWPCVQVRQ